MATVSTLPPPINVTPNNAISTIASIPPTAFFLLMVAIIAPIVIYIILKMFRKPNYKFWLLLIEGDEIREIPLIRIDEVNFVSARGNIRVYKDPTVRPLRKGNRFYLFGWGANPYYIAKVPDTLYRLGIADLVIKTGMKNIKFDDTWSSVVDLIAYLMQYRADNVRELVLDSNTELAIALNYPTFVKSLVEDMIHVNIRHGMRQLEELLNIERRITAVRQQEEGWWMRYLIIGMMIIGIFMIVALVLHH